MVTINPADCRPDEVYEGVLSGATNPQPRVMQRLANGQERGAWKVLTHDPEAYSYYSDIDVIPLVRLVPAREVSHEDRGELWALIRDELRGVYPSISDQDHLKLDLAASAAADAVVAHLNANGGLPASSDGVYGIPREDYGYVDWPATCAAEIERADRAEADRDRWRCAHAIVEQERDQARRERDEAKRNRDEAASRLAGVRDAHQRSADAHMKWKARAEAAERERDEADQRCAVAESERDRWKLHHDRVDGQWAKAEREVTQLRAEAAEKRHTWPKVTPTGHTYVAPDTYVALCHQHSNAAQAEVECWEADECPPEPTWEMVGIAHREVERIQRDYCECQEELIEASLERDQWMARAEAAEARTTPAVTKAEVAAVIDYEWYPRGDQGPDTCIDRVWSLVSGDDPAVFVVRESDLPEVQQDEDGFWRNKDGVYLVGRAHTAEGARANVLIQLRRAAEFEAVARAIEAEPADQVVYAIRESDLPHMEDDYLRNFDLGDGRSKFRNATDEEIGEAREVAESDLRWMIAVQQRIEVEAKQPDQVEAKARELYGAYQGTDRAHLPWDHQDDEGREPFIRMAAHVLGQETDHA